MSERPLELAIKMYLTAETKRHEAIMKRQIDTPPYCKIWWTDSWRRKKMAERMTHDSCEGCRHNLGGGCCRINEEAECGAGDRELWENEGEQEG